MVIPISRFRETEATDETRSVRLARNIGIFVITAARRERNAFPLVYVDTGVGTEAARRW
jgi:hypothetical protein